MPTPSSGIAGMINGDSSLIQKLLSGMASFTPVAQADLMSDASTNGTTYLAPNNLATDAKIGCKTVRVQMVADCISGVSGSIKCFRFVMVSDPFTIP